MLRICQNIFMLTAKTYAQQLLQRVGLYHRLKVSRLYDCYWWLADRRVLDNKRAEISFYREALEGFREGYVIFDIGANQGSKTECFLKLGARVVAVEPDPSNQEVLREKFTRMTRVGNRVDFVRKAVSYNIGVDTMWVDAPGSAKNTLSEKWVQTLRADEQRFGARLEFGQKKEIETTTLDQLIETYGAPFFVKIDVEGFEVNVLRGLSVPVPYLSFEINLPEFKNEGLDCISLLDALSHDGQFNYVVECADGFVLKQWLRAAEFSQVLDRCRESSIEVFWKVPGTTLGRNQKCTTSMYNPVLQAR